MEGGVQESNLTGDEKAGSKSLQKRAKDNELVVLSMDESGRLVVMSLQTYEKAGQVNTSKDKEVTQDVVTRTYRKINVNVSMMLKIFKLGKN